MPTKGNILLVANWESNVGYAWWLMENFWVAISENFNRKGITSYLIYPKITQIPESIVTSGMEIDECDFTDRSFSNLRKLHKYIKTNKIRHIYLTDMPPYSLLYLLLRLWGVKNIIVHDHTPGDRFVPAAWMKPVKSLIQKIPLYTADHFIAVSEFVHNRMIEVSRISHTKCSIAPNGIHPIDLDNVEQKYAYRAFGIPEDRIIVITTGRASYYKGIDFFIKCANELINNQSCDQLHFLFCGDGPDIQDFRDMVYNLCLYNNFTFAGKRTDIAEILPSCKIGFHTATGEVGYSLSILEYMSAGLVTIVPDRPSTSAATQHLNTGLIYHHKDIISACNAIKQGLSDELAETISRNAIYEIKENYNIKNTNDKLISILNDVL